MNNFAKRLKEIEDSKTEIEVPDFLDSLIKELEDENYGSSIKDSHVTILELKDNKYNFNHPNLFGLKRKQENDSGKKSSENFEVYRNSEFNFDCVGGYSKVKSELSQCLDTLKDHTKYSKYNVRIPQGLIIEGPPGTGKTLLAKALAGESDCAFIPVSGSDFQEKYVGVGPTRIKELFQLARQNLPCIIFIDEIDALGRKRSGDGEASSSERDSTLNALLVELDGFKNSSGIFLVAATNRIDLLDAALTRPGRIDKKINIGLPDKATRKAILKIHISGKPHDETVKEDELIEMTGGFSGAQIENLLNEAMLFALRENRAFFNSNDLNVNLNKMIAGWQPNEHEFTDDMIDRIVVHEMGHAIAGMLSKYHSKVSKVVINLSSPRSPGYTIFESNPENIYVREGLFEHLIILLSGRVAEEIIYDASFTTGAINDFAEALNLAEKMIVQYGMGTRIIYPSSSDKYKQLIDDEVASLINTAYKVARSTLENCKDLINETSAILKEEKILKVKTLNDIIESKYPDILELKNSI
jgi:cell division protease FtsH